ncbi:MAG: phosphoenolpyruvate--protein phosphotransferase [Sedimentisphaerales bacterium]|nr:phosphoenolpyruvate--protein phosphotransferase [Sedimentisphaerales bacterium]
MDRIKLLCDISELNHLFRESVSIESFLHETVRMVTHHLKTEVCSIYLYDEDDSLLVMKATEGLNPDSVDQVKMKYGEGLTGLALKEMRPICVSRASKHPNYKLFVGTDEEQYDNFLAVPITRGPARIGVLTLQRKKKKKFEEEDVMACRAVASQLANIIENAKFLMSMHQAHAPVEPVEQTRSIPTGLEFVRGKTAAEGFALGPAHVVDKEKTFDALYESRYDQAYTLEQFDQAVKATEIQLEDLQGQVEEKLTDAASLIFASHLLILKDKEFVGTMRRLIEEGENPPVAALKMARQYIDLFRRSANVYVREKVQDVEDLIVRLIGNLVQEYEKLGDFKGRVVIARDLFPSDLLRMSSENVAGAVLVAGGVTSHIAILARSLQIPMVIANNYDLLHIPDDTQILLDADTGNVYVDPSNEVIASFQKRNTDRLSIKDQIAGMKSQTRTADGTRIRLLANINLLSDLSIAEQLKCEGVGLYRTEFPFIIRNDFPSEQEQYFTYRRLVLGMKNKPITFRTLDIGGDKVLSYYNNAHEQNPGMGMRSIRFSLQNRRIFTQQLRAMLRAGINADMRIMFPMIASTDDFRQARKALTEAMASLDQEGIPYFPSPKVGIMVELPSVVHMIHELAAEADFFSIGTNDFIQFLLGVDRTNETVAGFYIPHHPAVLRAIKLVIDAAQKRDKEVSVCGDMAHQSEYIPLLLGLGIRTLSLDPSYLPRVQKLMEQLEIQQTRRLAEQALAADTTEQVASLLGIRQTGS